MSTFFITTAIDYTNGAPHIGHAYEKVLADVLARYHRLKVPRGEEPGDHVFFLTGVDQHGQKVQQSAEKQGVAPQEFVDGITAKFRALWEKLNVRYDGWAATTDTLHKEAVRANLQMLWDEKDPATGQSRWLYKKTQRGFYSVRQEQFLTDKERGADGEFGPEWQPVEEREEENFYFRLTQDAATGLPGFDPKQWLLDFLDARSRDGKPFVIPDFRVAELRNAVEKLDGDLCISRPAARLQWGIPFPELGGAGVGFVTYVWFDALVNYISFVPGHDPAWGEKMKDEGGRMKRSVEGSDAVPPPPQTAAGSSSSSFSHWWPALHVIGKDIMIPAHGVYWPIMLKALGFTDAEMPTLLVHGWWNISGAKMSKSLGNVIDPDALADKYGAEAVRYYLVSDIATGKDADFSEERLIQRYNTDLANSLGNLLNRTLSMAAKYRGSNIRRGIDSDEYSQRNAEGTGDSLSNAGEFSPTALATILRFVEGAAIAGPGRYRDSLDTLSVGPAIEEANESARLCNTLVEVGMPWKLAKDPARSLELDAVLYHLAESLRIIAILLSPVLPQAAQEIFDQLNWKMDERGKETRFRLADAVWGELGKDSGSHQLGQPTPLFPRIEVPRLD